VESLGAICGGVWLKSDPFNHHNGLQGSEADDNQASTIVGVVRKQMTHTSLFFSQPATLTL
jgi:hypothetical protein